MSLKPKQRIQTTLRLPAQLYEQAKSVVERNLSQAQNLNDLIVTALGSYVKMIQRRQIDAAFAGMTGDDAYQKEAQRITDEFAASDWEALELAEKEAHAAR